MSTPAGRSRHPATGPLIALAWCVCRTGGGAHEHARIPTCGGGYLEPPRPSGLADVIDVILDKGLVIDAYVRVSLVGIELLTIDARIVIASVDTYLRFAEAVGRLDLREDSSQGLPELMESVTSGLRGFQVGDQGCLGGRKGVPVRRRRGRQREIPTATALLILTPPEEQLSTQTSRRRRLPTPCRTPRSSPKTPAKRPPTARPRPRRTPISLLSPRSSGYPRPRAGHPRTSLG